MVAIGFYLFHLDSPEASALGLIDVVVMLLRFFGLVTLVVMTIAGLLVAPPLLQWILRRHPTIELLEDGFILSVGLDQRRRISWSDTSWIQSVRLRPPLQVGWVAIGFVKPQRGLGSELSVPDLYLDCRVEDVVEAMNTKLEQWRYPFGKASIGDSSG